MSQGQPENSEDLKIISLARAALARTSALAGACVRDVDGRTYAGSTVDLPHLTLSPVAVAIAMAASSGAGAVEAVAWCGKADPDDSDRAIIADLAPHGAVLWVADPSGLVRSRIDVDGST
jgi:hypothetical protein